MFTSNDVSFIRADESGHIYYYVATTPHFVVNNDTPDIQFKVFRMSGSSSEQYFAQLQMQTELYCDEQTARRAAKANPDIPDDALLQPLQILSSTATLGLPGLISPQAQPTALGNQQRCVLQAGFSKTSDIELLTSLLRAPDNCPISIIYKLTYLQTLPPSQFELKADWDKVYHYLKTNIGFNALIFSVDIERVSKELISNKSVEIKTRNTNPEGYITQAAQELSQILLTEFFSAEQPEIKDKSSEKLGFYLLQVSIESIEKRSLSAQLTETSVVQRAIFPQAFFSQLIRSSHYDANQIISQKDVHDDFFATRTVEASLVTECLDPNISLIHLQLTYGTNLQSYVFTPTDLTSKKFKAPSIVDPKTGKMEWTVSYCFTVHFNQAIGGRFAISSQTMTTELNQIFLETSSLYSQFLFNINVLPSFNWDWYSNVITTIGYAPLSDLNSVQSRAFQLTKTDQTAQYQVMLPDPSQYQFMVSKNYTVTENSPHISATTPAPANLDIIVSTPVFAQRTLLISASVNWQKLHQILVIAHYQYDSDTPEHTLQQRLLFTPQETAPQTFSADQPNPALRTVQLTVLVTDQQRNTQSHTTSTDLDLFDLVTLT